MGGMDWIDLACDRGRLLVAVCVVIRFLAL